MAKRRNAKKEKAARNKTNAQKFRKPTSRYSRKGRRYFNSNNQNSDRNSSSESKPMNETVETN
ncbi:MAG: hypothetical protein ACFCU5_04450 [Pleurocapsa sp.]